MRDGSTWWQCSQARYSDGVGSERIRKDRSVEDVLDSVQQIHSSERKDIEIGLLEMMERSEMVEVGDSDLRPDIPTPPAPRESEDRRAEGLLDRVLEISAEESRNYRTLA
jgi:hypothetical protein